MLAQPKPQGNAPPIAPQRALFLALTLLSLSACQREQEPNCSPEAFYLPGHECFEADRSFGGGGEQTPASHRSDCLDTDGPLCLAEVSWQDAEARRGAITPGERITVESITLVNSDLRPLQLQSLVLRPGTSGLSLEGGALSLLSLSGRSARGPLEPFSDDEACAVGRIEPLGACTFELNTALSIDEEAPLDQQQSALFSLEYLREGQGARATLSAPLLVIDPTRGLGLGEVSLDDSSRDGAINPGDRVRFPEIPVFNESLVAFENLEVHISSDSPWLSFEGRGEMWSDGDEVASGLVSSPLVSCPAAILSEGSRRPSPCVLELPTPFLVSPEAPIGEELSFELRFKAQGDRLPERFTLSFEVTELESSVRFEELILESDQNRDQALSPGERVSFHKLSLFNEGPSALSLQGRVSVVDGAAELLSSSDMSVDLSAQEGSFYERCSAGERCLSSVRLRLALSPELAEGDEVTLRFELVDQTGSRHEAEWSFEVTVPHVELELDELRVTQDTLDERLSGGERGLISYIKLINHGDADAIDLSGEIWTDSPYILSADGRASWPLDLREMSGRDDAGGDNEGVRCVSLTRDEGAYCYQRLELPFEVSPTAPVGERVTFWIDLTDSFGQAYQLSYELQLF